MADDDELDNLYALPLAEFIAERNALAKRLSDPEIRKLKKPTVPAWAVNQLVRRREVDVRRLLRAGEKLEEAQREAVLGGKQRPFEEARRDEREAVRRLRSAAAELLREGGHPANDATLERVAKTLNAAAATETGRAALRAGRLTEEIEPQGFDALAALAGSIPERRPAKASAQKAPTQADRRRAKQAREEADAARREAETARREAADVEARVADAERELRNAERAVEKARAAAARAADKAERLEARAAELAV